MKEEIMAFIIRRLGWGWLPSALFQFRRKIRNSVWSSAPGAVCVDVCCGTGLTSIEKAMESPNTRFYCIDINQAELNKGRKLANALGLRNVYFICSDAYRLPLVQRSVSTFIVANILRDLPDVSFVLQSFSKTLEEQSTMIIETPVAPQKHFLFKRKALRNLVKSLVNPDHGFLDGELEELLERIDFVRVQHKRSFYRLGVLARECHYILTAIHPCLSMVFGWPLYLMMLFDQHSCKGNALTLQARRSQTQNVYA